MKEKLNDFLPDASAPLKQMVLGQGEDFTKVTLTDVKGFFKIRTAFSHKGTYGHALIVAGAQHTMGAALLTSKGCLYGGAGLTTAAIPESGLSALNTALPEVMYTEREKLNAETDFTKYNVIAIGPGIGHSPDHVTLLEKLISLKLPVVLDADALNVLAGNKALLKSVSGDIILTPHVKEFDKLFGEHTTWWERLQTARTEAKERGIIIVLKNQYTFVIDQEGFVHINSTGNPAMAQGGMGDALTGIITAFIAQGYTLKEAAILGCYVHGAAGDELAKSHANITASQICEQLPKTIKWIF